MATKYKFVFLKGNLYKPEQKSLNVNKLLFKRKKNV